MSSLSGSSASNSRASNFTEAHIRRHATAQSFHRGEEYYRAGALIALIQ